MSQQPTMSDSIPDPFTICFGLNRETDEESLATFLRHFTSTELLETLIPRLTDDEIKQVVEFATGIMHNHLQEDEYHSLFLKEEHK